jgi:hypothetical protein
LVKGRKKDALKAKKEIGMTGSTALTVERADKIVKRDIERNDTVRNFSSENSISFYAKNRKSPFENEMNIQPKNYTGHNESTADPTQNTKLRKEIVERAMPSVDTGYLAYSLTSERIMCVSSPRRIMCVSSPRSTNSKILYIIVLFTPSIFSRG